MNARKRSALLAVLTALTLALAACGQTPATTAPAAPPAVEQPAAQPAQPAAAAPATDVKAVALAYLATMPEGFNAITKVEGLKELMAAEPLIVDVREPAEYAEGHIPGAVNIPLRTLTQNLDKIPTDKPVVLTCASGLRASYATTALQILGYSNVRDFFPSYKGWTAANEPVTTEAAEAVAVAAPATVDPAILAEVEQFLTGLPENYFNVGKVEALKEMLDAGNVTLIDVREPSEFAEGRIPGAINIPLRSLGEKFDGIPTDQPVVVSCASGLRCSLATPALHLAGLTNVRTFTPSFKGWSAANMEIEK